MEEEKREKRSASVHHERFISKIASHCQRFIFEEENFVFVKSPSQTSWKHRKKKLTFSRRSALKENVSWKRRKKKTSLNTNQKFIQGMKRLPLKEVAAWKCRKKKPFWLKSPKFVFGKKSLRLSKSRTWKRRKKKDHCSKRLFHEYDWDPGIAFKSLSLLGKSAFAAGECCDACVKKENVI